MSDRSLADITTLLSSSLGEKTAREVVEREARRAGVGNTLTEDEASSLLSSIEQGGGPPGLAARLAKIRMQRSAGASSGTTRAASDKPSPRLATDQLIAMFSPALGLEKASETVKNVLLAIGVTGATMTYDEAHQALERLGRQGGVVATVARFAKARLLLSTGA
jgi:hypothetical protein